ncbi:MAG: hypothetical protein JWM76_1309 [Pseudonocardiales bacterium]|nr:hypothetical protein [Pseudonocardiales bacterium]
MASLFHIVASDDWEAAVGVGSYSPPSLAADGFVHLSHRHQVEPVANSWYADLTGLVVVELDPARLGAEVVEEDSYGKGEEFPHLYAAIPTSAAVAVHPLPRGENGRFSFGG